MKTKSKIWWWFSYPPMNHRWWPGAFTIWWPILRKWYKIKAPIWRKYIYPIQARKRQEHYDKVIRPVMQAKSERRHIRHQQLLWDKKKWAKPIVEYRETLRADKLWEKADVLRDLLEFEGLKIKDKSDGTTEYELDKRYIVSAWIAS